MNLSEVYGILGRELLRPDERIQSIEYDSRKVKHGDIFIALRGERYDGHTFIKDVLEKGASLVIGEEDVLHPLYERVHDTKKILAILCHSFYKQPSEKLNVVGVVGTNGKTTITYLIQHVFESLGIDSGLIGTNEFWVGKKAKSTHTTPLSKELNELLLECVNHGLEYMVMEVSSHGIKENRVDQLQFKRLIFTNITPEHLDYHKTFEDYLFTKMRVFTQFCNYSENKVAILNIDDSNADYFINVTNGKVITYGLYFADVLAKNIQFGIEETVFDLYVSQKLIGTYTIKLFGKYNVYNVLAVIAYFYSLGYEPKLIASYLEGVRTIEGRFNYHMTDSGIGIAIDYAHNPDAVYQVLSSLSESSNNQVITVIGAGGNRDQSKRKVMGKTVTQLSKHVVFTSDNPRYEDPVCIINDMLEEVQTTNYQIEIDRAQAIEEAIKLAKTGDVVLVLGKGHEKTQNINGKILPFNDKIVVEEVIRKRGI